MEQTEEQRKRTFAAAGLPLPPIPALNTESLQPVSAPTLTPVPPATLPNVGSIPITEPKTTEPSGDDLVKQLESLTTTSLGKADVLKEQTTQQTAAFQQQLNEVNKQIKMHQAQAFADQEEALRRGETLGFATGEAARVNRENAVQTLRLSAISEALQGNITFAKSQAESAVNTQFKALEAQLQTARQNIMNNYDNMTTAQKKKADAALLRLDKEDAFVAEKKAAANEVQKAVLSYVGIADNLTLDEMSKAGSALEVAQIAANKGIKTLEQQKAERELRGDSKLQFISGTANQPGGVFNPATGVFTPIQDIGGGGYNEAQLRTLNQADVAVGNIDKALGLLNKGTIGISTSLTRAGASKIPGTASYDLAQTIDTVKALIGFNELEKMRQASPTGGALGQVSERELAYLQSVAGSLDIGQKTATLKTNLEDIKKSFSTLTFMIQAKGEGYSDEEIQEFLKAKGEL